MEGGELMNNELYHHGVKGMKWGVRRYQNPDGSLTKAGRKRYAQSIGNKNTNALNAEFNARKTFRNVKELTDYQQAGVAYRDAAGKVALYNKHRDELFNKKQAISRPIVESLIKKYGRFDDLERDENEKAMRLFEEERARQIKQQFKKYGIYDEEKRVERDRAIAYEARKNAREETRKVVSDLLGKYGDQPLRGSISYFSMVGSKTIYDSISDPTINDAVTEAILGDLNGVHYSFEQTR